MLRYVALYCLPYFTLHSLQTTPNLTFHCIELQYGESHWLVCPRFSHIRMGIAGWPFGHEMDNGMAVASLLPLQCDLTVKASWDLLG